MNYLVQPPAGLEEMWYAILHAKTTGCPRLDPRRATSARRGGTLCPQLYLAALPNPARQQAWAVCPADRRGPRVPRPDRAPRHSRLQYPRVGGHTARLISAAPHAP